jgi:hypothetical protein
MTMAKKGKKGTKKASRPKFELRTQERYSHPNRVGEHEQQGWEVVKNKPTMRNGSVLMRRTVKVPVAK